jgi:hypothetical protein
MEHQPQAARNGADSRHAAIVEAEVRYVERQLRAYGPMSRPMLARRCRERAWREGTLEEAVREGFRQRRLKQLPLGWVASRR